MVILFGYDFPVFNSEIIIVFAAVFERSRKSASEFNTFNRRYRKNISRYNISESSAGKPQSVKGVMPWVNINFDDAKKVASTIEDNEAVKSHLTFGAEYDSVLEWFIKTESKTRAEIAEDSTEWGNYWNAKNSPRKVVETNTGSREEWCANNIYDLAGNVNEWTQERNKNLYRVTRGGDYGDGGDECPVAYRGYSNPDGACFFNTGFRATLYIK